MNDLNVLLVDADSRHLRLVENAGHPHAWSVSVASSLHDALERLRAGRYDVIVAAHHLPDGDAVTLLRHVRSAGRRTPLVVLTRESRAGLSQGLLDAGVADVIHATGTERHRIADVVEQAAWLHQVDDRFQRLKELEERRSSGPSGPRS